MHLKPRSNNKSYATKKLNLTKLLKLAMLQSYCKMQVVTHLLGKRFGKGTW